MEVVKSIKKLKEYLALKPNKTIGFVPTMGALHKGHISLIEQSIKSTDITICSIFVNPTQFNEKKDFEKYPLSIEEDIKLLEEAKCDCLFAPQVKEIYPTTQISNIEIDLERAGECMEASHRPGHFDGVIQVVKRLLDIVNPNYLFLGKKDFQQCVVIEKMIAHFKLPVEVIRCEIIRADDGLAMSSRNRRLSKEERVAALLLNQILQLIVADYPNKTPRDLTETYSKILNENTLIEVEYLEIADNQTLEEVVEWKNHSSTNVFVAAKVGEIRLIDNRLIY